MVAANAPSGACPAPERLADYVDGRLSGEDHAEMQRHLADCEDCREVVSEAALLRNEPLTAPVVPFLRRRRIQLWGGGVFALAASLILVIQVRPELNPFGTPAGIDELVTAVGPRRLIEARLTGGFEYGPLHSRPRGPEASPDDLRLQSEAGLLRERALSTNDPSDLHAWGTAQVLMGRHREGEATLERALEARPRDAGIAADLGAARAMRVLADGELGESAAAEAMLDRALSLDGSVVEAWFNKALVLERAGRTAEALAAWNAYLALDAESQWAAYARERRSELQAAQRP